MEPKPKSDHLLALKMMQLTRPTIATPVIVTSDSSNLPGNTLNNELKNDCTSQGMERLAVGQFMLLPQSFGNLFKLSLCNGSNQVVKCIKPQSSLMENPKMLHNTTQIGKLHIVWRSNTGEKGRLQTSQLHRMPPDYGDLRVTAKNLPDIEPESVVSFDCHIINTSERNMDLLMTLDDTDNEAFDWNGNLELTTLGTLKPLLQ